MAGSAACCELAIHLSCSLFITHHSHPFNSATSHSISAEISASSRSCILLKILFYTGGMYLHCMEIYTVCPRTPVRQCHFFQVLKHQSLNSRVCVHVQINGKVTADIERLFGVSRFVYWFLFFVNPLQ